MPKAPLSEEQWEKLYRKRYGKPPTGMELKQFKKDFPTPTNYDERESVPEDEADDSDPVFADA